MMTPLMMVTAATQRKSVALETPKTQLRQGEPDVIGKNNPPRVILDGFKQEKQEMVPAFKKKTHIKIIKV